MNDPTYQTLTDYVSILKQPGNLIIRRRWFSWRYVVPFFMIIGAFAYFAPKFLESENKLWGIYLILFMGAWFGYVLYYVLTKLVNSTYIRVDDNYISVDHGPLPWAKKVVVHKDHIAHLADEEKRYKGRSRRRYHQVNVVTPENHSIKLVGDIDFPVQATVIKEEIEKFLATVSSSRKAKSDNVSG